MDWIDLAQDIVWTGLIWLRIQYGSMDWIDLAQDILWGSMDWIDLAQDRGPWKVLLNTVLKYRIPQNARKFLSVCAT
jgi:hypothetical protein